MHKLTTELFKKVMNTYITNMCETLSNITDEKIVYTVLNPTFYVNVKGELLPIQVEVVKADGSKHTTIPKQATYINISLPNNLTLDDIYVDMFLCRLYAIDDNLLQTVFQDYSELHTVLSRDKTLSKIESDVKDYIQQSPKLMFDDFYKEVLARVDLELTLPFRYTPSIVASNYLFGYLPIFPLFSKTEVSNKIYHSLLSTLKSTDNNILPLIQDKSEPVNKTYNPMSLLFVNYNNLVDLINMF